MTKEDHASKIITVVGEYFLTQKMKAIPSPDDKEAYQALVAAPLLLAYSDTAAPQEYLEKLAAHHAVLVAAMKAKQSMDMKTAEALQAAIVNMIVVGKYF